MLQRLQKILGDGREEAFLGEGVFIDGNNSADDIADETEADLVNNFAELDDFLNQVRNAFQTKSEKRGQ